MRLPWLLVSALVVAAPATAQMVKCTTRDGTVLYQSRPCGSTDRQASIGNGIVAATDANATNGKTPSREAVERAVLERDTAQRRARCAVYRDNVERDKALLASPNDVARAHAANDIKLQERRMKDDDCAAL